MNPFKICPAALAALASVVCMVFLWQAPSEVEKVRIQNPISQEEIRLGSPRTVADQPSEDPAPAAVPTRSMPADWSHATTLQSAFIPIEGHPTRFERHRLVQAPDFEQAVLLIEGVAVDSLEGVIVQELYDSMIANQIVVSSPTPIDPMRLNELLTNTGWTLERISRNGLISILGSPSADLDTVKNGLSLLQNRLGPSQDLVVEPNRIYYAAITEPNDPLYLGDQLWGLNNPFDSDIDAPEGWDIRTDASDIIIAISDSGIREDHEDLIENLWNNADEIPDNGIDDDNNGYIDDDFGVNILDTSRSASDDNGHGTLVAGIAGASGDNGIGVTGVAWQTNLMAVKFMNASGRGTLEDAIEAIDYALENGADIINASWGSPGESPSLESALERALEAGVFVVAAAGNESDNIDQTYYHPASSDLANVITVASVKEEGSRSGFSNYGSGVTDLAAPGSNILSSSHLAPDAYSLDSGTSLAAPYVSGILALNLAQWPEDDMQTHVDRLIVSSKPRAFLDDVSRSRGIVSLGQSLAMETVPYPPVIESHSELKIIANAGKDVSMTVSVSSESEVSYAWYFENSLLPNETSTALSLSQVSESDQGRYRFVASNEDGEASIEFELTVLTPDPDLAEGLDLDSPNIVYSPYDTLWSLVSDPLSKDGDHIEGRYSQEQFKTNILSAVVTGPGDLRFLWKLAGLDGYSNLPEFYVEGEEVTQLSGRDEWRVVHYRLEEARNYEITWIFENSTNTNTDNGRLIIDYLKVFPIGQAPPIIFSHPRSKVIRPFDDTSFYVSATGEEKSYEWFHNDSSIPFSDNRDISIRDAQAEDAGEYYVVVSNPYGSDTSHPATLEVDESQTPARFIENNGGLGNDFKGIVGNRLDVTLEHVGSPPMQYTWLRDNIPLPGQNGPVLSFVPLRKEHAGRYDLIIDNPYGDPDYTNSVYVYVIDRDLAPGIVLDDRNLSHFYVKEGEAFDPGFQLGNELHPLEFQWYKDGVPLAGQTSLNLYIDEIRYEDGGIYALEFKNDFGTYRDDVYEIIVDIGVEEALELPKSELGLFESGDDSEIRSQREVSYDGEDALLFTHGFPQVASFEEKSEYAAYIGRVFEGPVNVSFFWKRTSENGWFQTYIGSYPYGDLPLYKSHKIPDEEILGEWTQSVVHIPEGEHYLNWGFVGSSYQEKGWLDKVEITDAPAFASPIPEAILSGTDGLTVHTNIWGPGTRTYQWYKDGIPIPGENSASIFLDQAATDLEDRFWVTVETEFGTTRSTEFKVVPVTAAVETEGESIILGGTAYWEHFPKWNSSEIKVTVGPNDHAWMEFYVSGPSVFSFDGSAIKTLLNDAPLETVNWTAPVYPIYREFAYIPPGDHTLRIEINGNEEENHTFTHFPRDLQLRTAPFIENDNLRFDGSGPIAHYLAETAVSFLAAQPATVRWYKDGQLVREDNSVQSGISHFFESWWDVSPDPSHVGSYYCEVEDADGNIGRSAEMIVREVDTRTFGELVGDTDFKIGNTGYRFYADTEIFIEGSASARTTMTSETTRSSFSIGTSNHIEGAFNTSELKIKFSGFDEETVVTVSNGSEYKTQLDLSEEWQTIKVNGKSSSIHFAIQKSIGSTIKLWIDGMKSQIDTRLQIVKHPYHYASYLGGRAAFYVEGFSASPISYQWMRNGVDIPGATNDSFHIRALSESQVGEYTVSLQSEGQRLVSRPASLSVAEDLGAALEVPGLKIRTWGDALWTVDKSVSIDGTSSLRSGDLEPGQVSTLRIEFDYPGMFSVYRKRERSDGKKTSWSGGSDFSESGPFAREFTLRREPEDSRYTDYRYMRLDRLSFSALSLQSYNQWLQTSPYITNSVNANDTLIDEINDTDEDGIANYLEYLFDLNPLQRSFLPGMQFKWSGNQLEAFMDYRFAATGEYVLRFETSDDLENWRPVPHKYTQNIDSSNTYLQVRSSIDLTLPIDKTAFYRWNVIKTGPSGTPLESK